MPTNSDHLAAGLRTGWIELDRRDDVLKIVVTRANGALPHSLVLRSCAAPPAKMPRNLFLRHLVDRVLDVGREIDRPGFPDADAGRNVGRQAAGRAGQSDRQIARD